MTHPIQSIPTQSINRHIFWPQEQQHSKYGTYRSPMLSRLCSSGSKGHMGLGPLVAICWAFLAPVWALISPPPKVAEVLDVGLGKWDGTYIIFLIPCPSTAHYVGSIRSPPPPPPPLFRKLGTPPPHKTSTYGNNGSPKNLLFHFFGRKQKIVGSGSSMSIIKYMSCTTQHTHSLPLYPHLPFPCHAR